MFYILVERPLQARGLVAWVKNVVEPQVADLLVSLGIEREIRLERRIQLLVTPGASFVNARIFSLAKEKNSAS
jgi:hypothetical protein